MVDGKVLPLNLGDLFSQNSNWNQKLTELMTKMINEQQVYGLACPDINAAIASFKTTFILTDKGIVFRDENANKTLTIYWAQLKDLLLHPDWVPQ